MVLNQLTYTDTLTQNTKRGTRNVFFKQQYANIQQSIDTELYFDG